MVCLCAGEVVWWCVDEVVWCVSVKVWGFGVVVLC